MYICSENKYSDQLDVNIAYDLHTCLREKHEFLHDTVHLLAMLNFIL